MTHKYRAVARRSAMVGGFPRVGREEVGLYSSRTQAETACREFVKSHATDFRSAYDDCIVELVVDGDEGKVAG